MVKVSAQLNAKVKRGEESYQFFYSALAISYAFEGSIIAMMPIPYAWNIAVFLLVGLFTGWLVLDCGWFQNKLVGYKKRWEGKSR